MVVTSLFTIVRLIAIQGSTDVVVTSLFTMVRLIPIQGSTDVVVMSLFTVVRLIAIQGSTDVVVMVLHRYSTTGVKGQDILFRFGGNGPFSE